MWKGDSVGLYQLHDWIRARLVKSEECQKCHKIKELDLANKSGKYLRDLNDWEWLCRSCHMLSDGRMNNLKQYQSGSLYRVVPRMTK
jgi:nitrate/TMAO reductase-like tetraheme cytochrome c subunit